jgi:hypothetical protein
MAVALTDELIIDDAGNQFGTNLEQRRAEFRRRRRAVGVREYVSLAATGAIGLWIVAVVFISLGLR